MQYACIAEASNEACGNFCRCVVTSDGFSNGGRIMILGMSLATFTMVHVIISLIAIVAGLVVMFGLLGPQPACRA